jgi:hypothetical protein
MATGTATITDTGGAGNPRRIKIACASNASGVVISDAFYIDGILAWVETIPDGTDVPTSYNMQIRRRNATTGFDILGGSGASRSATAVEECRPQGVAGDVQVNGGRGDEFFLCADTVGVAKKFIAYLYVLQTV